MAVRVAKEYPELKECAKAEALSEWECAIDCMYDRGMFYAEDMYEIEDEVNNMLEVYKEISSYEDFFKIKLDLKNFNDAVVNHICNNTNIDFLKNNSIMQQLPDTVYTTILENKDQFWEHEI